MLKNRLRLTLSTRKAIKGYIFTLPFIIGALLFIIYPFVQSVIFSLNELVITPQGYELTFVGLANYRHAIFVHTTFVRVFVETMLRTLVNIPAIIIFSFFAANLLNQKFKGRMLARTIFFLPVILTAGVVQRMEQDDYFHQLMSHGETGEAGGLLSSAGIETFLMQIRLPEGFIEYIIEMVDIIPEIINAAGIPILIFLAGLQSIPSSLFEAADIEGATAWESFWKITFPLISPMFLTNVVYIVIDSFTAANNELVVLIRNVGWGGAGYGVGSAMAWMYFLAVSLLLVVIIGIISGRVVYLE